MNTSELFFNTPVIDEQGQVKKLSDFGGGGGGDLPIASADTLGGVKIGDGISITEDGTISSMSGFKEFRYTGDGNPNRVIDTGFTNTRLAIITKPNIENAFMGIVRHGAIANTGPTGSPTTVAYNKIKFDDGVLTFTNLTVSGFSGYIFNDAGDEYLLLCI